jgi:hypothetical protein
LAASEVSITGEADADALAAGFVVGFFSGAAAAAGFFAAPVEGFSLAAPPVSLFFLAMSSDCTRRGFCLPPTRGA